MILDAIADVLEALSDAVTRILQGVSNTVPTWLLALLLAFAIGAWSAEGCVADPPADDGRRPKPRPVRELY